MTMDWLREGEGEHEEEGERERERERGEAPSGEAARVITRPVSVATSPARSPGPGLGLGPDWVPVGPSIVIGGELNSGTGRVTGRVSCLAVSPDGERVYVGTANGGVWYSEHGGVGWIPIDSYETRSSIADVGIRAPSLSIGAIFVLFGPNAARDRVFVGTGENVDSASAYGQSQHIGRGVRWAGDGVSTGPVPRVLLDPATSPWTKFPPETPPGGTPEPSPLIGSAIYRIAAKLSTSVPPTLEKVFLATSTGLYVRDFTAGGTGWDRIQTTYAWDVVCEEGGARRLWMVSSQTLFVSVNDGVHFEPVALPDTFPALTAPAGTTPPIRPGWSRVTLAAVPGGGVYVLAGGGRLWRASGVTAAVVVPGLPYGMFSSGDSIQSEYDMTLVAWADASTEVIVAGGMQSLVRGVVASPTGASPTMTIAEVGSTVHADAHALTATRLGSGAVRVFTGNDGGVFRSDTGAVDGSFRSMNTGLAVLQPFFLAGTPLSEAMLLIGTQDNGGIRSMSPETWANIVTGDAGGVAIDPADSRNLAAQYIHSRWRLLVDGARSEAVWFPSPAALVNASGAALTTPERDTIEKRFSDARAAEALHANAAFYSAASATLDPSTGKTLLAIGTRRVWISDDWGSSWKTLPTFTDPSVSSSATALRDLAPRADQDVLGNITTVKFAGPDRLLVLTDDAAYIFKRTGPSGSETWEKYKLPHPLGKSGGAVIRTDIAMHASGDGAHGSVFMTLAQRQGTARQHHVYWFDGMEDWVDTLLDIDAPTNAVVVDPLEPLNVYVGTDVGVFRGRMHPSASSAAEATWDWVHFSDGLPEAPVVDLVIDQREEAGEPPVADRVRLLRAALAGRGVFEIPVSPTHREPAIVAFIRAHDDDLRRSAIPATPRKSYLRAPAGTPRTGPLSATDYDVQRMDASPDIRVRRAPGTGSLLPLPATGTTNVLPFVADPSGELPDYADVVEFVVDEPDPDGFCSCRTHNQGSRIDVVVHTRHHRSLPAARVKVALLRAEYNSDSGTLMAPPLPATWRGQVLADRDPTRAGRGAWLSSTPWSYVDAADPIRDVGHAIDAREAGVATFRAALPVGTWMLVAIVLADDDRPDSLITELRPLELARLSRHVALRSVHVDFEPLHHTFQEWHQNQTPMASYRGTPDDQRVVERRAGAGGRPEPKPSLHLCTHESAVATFWLELPPGDHFAQWEIVSRATGLVVRTHPQLTPAQFTASAAGARLTSGQYAWRWDGRTDAGLLVSPGTYASRLRVKNATGETRDFAATIAAEGVAYAVKLYCSPKGADALRMAVQSAGQGPINSLGERITTDCDVSIERGAWIAGSEGDHGVHSIFLGHGTMESTRASAAAPHGAIAVPKGVLKGWIERSTPSGPYEIRLESRNRADGRVTLENATGPLPLNPFVSPPAAHIEGAGIAGTTATYTTDGFLDAGIRVREVTGSVASPAASKGTGASEIRARNATFGTFGAGTGEDLATRTPAFVNKQTKRSTPDDALETDTHANAQTHPTRSDLPPDRDEPLHMQSTLQSAVFGGLRAFELPTTSAARAAAVDRLSIEAALGAYAEGSAYHAYHHGVVLAHTYSATTNELSASIPRKVIRRWNGQGVPTPDDLFDTTTRWIDGGRNVLIPGQLTVVWYVEVIQLVPSPSSTILAHLIGTGPNTFVALPNVGRIARPFTMPTPPPAGLVRSVFRYRLRLAPFSPDHVWVPETVPPPVTPADRPGLLDPFSSNRAMLQAETLDGDTLVGESMMTLA